MATVAGEKPFGDGAGLIDEHQRVEPLLNESRRERRCFVFGRVENEGKEVFGELVGLEANPSRAKAVIGVKHVGSVGLRWCFLRRRRGFVFRFRLDRDDHVCSVEFDRLALVLLVVHFDLAVAHGHEVTLRTDLFVNLVMAVHVRREMRQNRFRWRQVEQSQVVGEDLVDAGERIDDSCQGEMILECLLAFRVGQSGEEIIQMRVQVNLSSQVQVIAAGFHQGENVDEVVLFRVRLAMNEAAFAACLLIRAIENVLVALVADRSTAFDFLVRVAARCHCSKVKIGFVAIQ